MMMHTHVVGALLFGLMVRPFLVQGHDLLFYAIVVMASFIPDLDHPTSWINNRLKITKIISAFVKHRGIFHSGLFGAGLGLLTYYFISATYAWALVVGFFSHLLLDSLTKEGINLLHPLSILHIRGPVMTNSVQETLLLLCMVVVLALQVF